jgi:hypothetical protein
LAPSIGARQATEVAVVFCGRNEHAVAAATSIAGASCNTAGTRDSSNARSTTGTRATVARRAGRTISLPGSILAAARSEPGSSERNPNEATHALIV